MKVYVWSRNYPGPVAESQIGNYDHVKQLHAEIGRRLATIGRLQDALAVAENKVAQREEEIAELRAKMGLWASQYEALVRYGELSFTTEAFAEEIARRIRAALAPKEDK